MSLSIKKGSAQEKALYSLKTQGPQTATELAERLAMTSMGARQHLQQLEAWGLVQSFDMNETRGRPKKYWQLTDKANEYFPDRHADMTLSLIENVKVVFGEEGLDRLILQREENTLDHYRQALDKLPILEDKVRRLAELRSQEGYMATVEKVHDNEFLFIENHCPICSAASVCQGFCRSELKIFKASLKAHVERVEYIMDKARRCAYRVFPLSG